jgi:Tol biopolymer transport system component
MNELSGLDRRLTAWLEEQAPVREPGGLLTVVTDKVARTRRLPGWLMSERWIPMQTRAQLGAAPRAALVLALLSMLILATAVAGAIALGQAPLPEPYGPARNGSLVYDEMGDIYLADASGTNTEAIITGPTFDHYPFFSHDGTLIAFARGQDSDLTSMVANADGTDVRELVPHVQWAEFVASDDQFVVTRYVDGRLVISIVDVDGQDLHDLDVGAIEPIDWVQSRPTDGAEIVFRGHPFAGSSALGFWAIGTDGSGLRQIGELGTLEPETGPLQDPVLSPDGQTIAYWSWEAKDGGSLDAYVHVRDLTTGDDQLLDLYPFNDTGSGPHFSPDGKSLLYESHSATVPDYDQLVIAPVDGSQPATPIGPSFDYRSRQSFDFSPDGAKVFLSQVNGTTVIDLTDAAATTTLPGIRSVLNWQRLAR